MNRLDAIISRLQNMSPFNIYRVTPSGDVVPWFEVTGGIVKDLVIREDSLYEQVQIISAQIMQWGRLAAQANRVWAITARQYRQWRDRQFLDLLSPVEKPEEWKKPTEKTVECTIRTLPDYKKHYEAQERAEEAYNAAIAVLEGFRAKKDMMKAAVIRSNESGAPRLSV